MPFFYRSACGTHFTGTVNLSHPVHGVIVGYLHIRYRRGKKRALIAVGRSILVIFYHMIGSGTSYAELGGDIFDRLKPERLARYYLKRLERLGHKVALES